MVSILFIIQGLVVYFDKVGCDAVDGLDAETAYKKLIGFCYRFSPAILLFLVSIIPSIWILELHHQQHKSSDEKVG